MNTIRSNDTGHTRPATKITHRADRARGESSKSVERRARLLESINYSLERMGEEELMRVESYISRIW